MQVIPKRSVASITKGLGKMVSDLEAHSNAELKRMEANKAKIAEIEADNAAAEKESAAARRISSNLGKILEGDI